MTTAAPVYLVKSRHTTPASLEKRFGGATVVDLTSKAPEPWVRFSPFYPHGGIPVPLSPGRSAQSVEGIWQALKVFEGEGVDVSKLENTTMRNLKRTVRRLGRCLGHRAGLEGEALLPYLEARRALYLPAYRWVLEHKLHDELGRLRELGRVAAAAGKPVILLDYETNENVDDPSKPLSHAGLVVRFLGDDWPPPRPLESPLSKAASSWRSGATRGAGRQEQCARGRVAKRAARWWRSRGARAGSRGAGRVTPLERSGRPGATGAALTG